MQSFSIQINEPDVIKVPTFFFHEYLHLPCLYVIQTRRDGRGTGGGLSLFSQQTFFLKYAYIKN